MTLRTSLRFLTFGSSGVSLIDGDDFSLTAGGLSFSEFLFFGSPDPEPDLLLFDLAGITTSKDAFRFFAL
jgi:hypothetical protein